MCDISNIWSSVYVTPKALINHKDLCISVENSIDFDLNEA